MTRGGFVRTQPVWAAESRAMTRHIEVVLERERQSIERTVAGGRQFDVGVTTEGAERIAIEDAHGCSAVSEFGSRVT